MDVLKALWKDKPLLIAFVAGIAAIVYILYKQNSANVIATGTAAVNSGANTPAAIGGGTYTEDVYNNYTYYSGSPTQTPVASPPTTAPPSGGKTPPPPPSGGGTPPPPPPPSGGPPPQIVPIAPRGTSTAGNGDTNWWPYTVTPGQTLLSIAQNVARWGNDTATLANYRNNAQIFRAAGINTSNPLVPVPAGLQISV